MKKKAVLALILILVVSVVLSACSSKDTQDVSNLGVSEIGEVRDLYPREDTVLIYKGGLNNKGQVTISQQLNGDRMQLSNIGEEIQIVEVYDFKKDGLYIVGGGEVEHFRKNYENLSKEFDGIVIKSPIALGDIWGEVGYETEVTAIDKEVTTPYGVLNTLELTSKGVNYTVRMYYANGLGLVKYLVDDETFLELHSAKTFDKDLKKLSEDDLKKLFETYTGDIN